LVRAKLQAAFGRPRRSGRFSPRPRHLGWRNGSEHRFTAEAIVNTTVRLIKRRSLEIAAESDALVSRNLSAMTTNNLQRRKDHMLLLPQDCAGAGRPLLDRDGPTADGGRYHATADVPARHAPIIWGLTLEPVPALSRLHEARQSSNLSGSNQRQIVLLDRPQLASLDLNN